MANLITTSGRIDIYTFSGDEKLHNAINRGKTRGTACKYNTS